MNLILLGVWLCTVNTQTEQDGRLLRWREDFKHTFYSTRWYSSNQCDVLLVKWDIILVINCFYFNTNDIACRGRHDFIGMTWTPRPWNLLEGSRIFHSITRIRVSHTSQLHHQHRIWRNVRDWWHAMLASPWMQPTNQPQGMHVIAYAHVVVVCNPFANIVVCYWYVYTSKDSPLSLPCIVEERRLYANF